MAINRDYLSFDAYAIKKRIEQKLSENSDFTDHIYPGSDLSIFIDVVSYTFQTLQYYLNQAGTEAMASDAQFYENINRIVKFLDYNPDGYSTSLVDTVLSGVPGLKNNTVLPPYSTVGLGTTDENGNEITFSTTDFYYMYDDVTVSQGAVTNEVPLYNGKWTLYESPFVAEGNAYETFTCGNLYSEESTKSYTAFPFVHALVQRGNQWSIFKPVRNSIFIDPLNQRTYGENERVFELRLDEFKNITLKFGDGIYGQKLENGDKVYIVYLKSNGPDGQVASRAITNLSLTTSINGLTQASLQNALQEEYSNLVNDSSTFVIPTSIVVNNYNASSRPQAEESVEDIRFSAPNHFRSGGRLITIQDYDAFIRGEFFKDVIDVQIQNNWSYMKTFLRWLYNSGSELQGDPSYYLSNDLKSRYGYEFSDSCDFNNIYAWIQMKTGFPIPKVNILRKIQSQKTITGEVIVLDPIVQSFIPCAKDNGYSVNNWDPNFENYIEIELTPTTLEAPQRIKNIVNSLILSYFRPENQSLGAVVNLDELLSIILGQDGVKRVRTVYKSSTTNETLFYNGLKFARWTPTILLGSDKELVSGSVKIEDFMFPRLVETTLTNRIKVITESAYGTNEVEY